MRLELLNVSKYRTNSKVGDDVPIVLPGAVIGICDGATDPRGTVVDGIGAGRLAALTLATAVTELALDPALRTMPGTEILARVSDALARRTVELDLPIPPSATLAAAFDCGDYWRFFALGDTGIRLNGTELFCFNKLLDAIATHARVAVFKTLAAAAPVTDATEAATRRSILLGFENAVAEGIITREAADSIIDATIDALQLDDIRALVCRFLLGGIQIQYQFGNDPESPLGFDTLNGVLPRRGEFIDVKRPKDQVRSIEIFTDGYPCIPETVSVEAWEAAFSRAEIEDVHKIGPFATVKGTTGAEYFDDRTVLVADRL
ncbi:hypothetical protein R3X27_05530 [Tropicimonas sp. TH_r6]|uniref:hypothetical protein n=1 Tax=Tropicimonas sp. TH_r6 TaxID=3082085 RepID=UPI00295513C0|nr:hypothetical protein [Tropicimonas sp. TH_r6]MDV7142139.1 hypothetical protein [Tropicimonas sp. TH_r6]